MRGDGSGPMIINFAWPSSAQYTGGVVAMYEFAGALSRLGNEVHFIHGPASPYRIERIEELDWFAFDPGIIHHVVDSLDDPSLVAGDIVFSPFVPARLGLPAVIVQGHGMIATTLERDTFRFRGLKSCVARWLVDVGVQYGSPPEQLVHVPCGIDHDLFRLTNPLESRPIDVALLFNAHPAKAFTVGLEALRRVHEVRPDLTVDVFGILPPDFDLPDWMRFQRGLDREHLSAQIYNQAKVFLQPSWYEGFGFTAVEAMASGCALVTTDNGGSQDYAIQGETAIIAPPGDVEGLAAGVEALLADAPRRLRQATAGMAHVRRFSWDRSGEELDGHLRRYLADPAAFQRPAGPSAEPAPPRIGELPAAMAAATTSAPGVRALASAPGRTPPADEDLVFNIVWTGVVFSTLQYFAASQIAQSRSRFRFVANGCHPDEVELMRAFQAAHPDRVVEVLVVSEVDMVAHGVALDRVRAQRDDGAYFCLIDPDIKANAPFVPEFAALAVDNAAVTSGREVWVDDNYVPVGNVGVAGEHFFDRNGFVFGSPHLSIYDRAVLDATCERWGVGLGSAGPELRQDAKNHLLAMGLPYLVYDTAKIVNALLQGDGHQLVHRDLPQLVHIGGLAHFISPPAFRTNDDGDEEPDWTIYAEMAERHAVARYTAELLQCLAERRPEPVLPTGIDPALATRLELVHAEITDLVQRYRADVIPVDPEPARAEDPAATAALAESERLLAAGEGRAAVDLLVDTAAHTGAPAVDVALVAARHRAATMLTGTGASGIAAGVDPFPPGTIPEVTRAELTPEVLAAGLANHGSVLVRGLIPPPTAADLLASVHQAFAAAEAAADGAPTTATSPWFVPFEPTDEFSFGAFERTFARSVGSVLAVESPRTLGQFVAAYRRAGLGELLEAFFGEWPVLSAKKTTLRRADHDSPSEWHQDGAFLGAGTRSVNVWLALTDCGERAPGVEVVPHAVDHIVETGTDDALFSWSVSPTRASATALVEPERPLFAPGDALLFDQMTLHRTDVRPTMTEQRFAIESWFFAPSTYPYEQVPILF